MNFWGLGFTRCISNSMTGPLDRSEVEITPDLSYGPKKLQAHSAQLVFSPSRDTGVTNLSSLPCTTHFRSLLFASSGQQWVLFRFNHLKIRNIPLLCWSYGLHLAGGSVCQLVYLLPSGTKFLINKFIVMWQTWSCTVFPVKIQYIKGPFTRGV